MKCDRCGQRDAVVHLTQLTEGIAAQRHLCVECAQAAGAKVGAWPATPPPAADVPPRRP